MPVRFARPWLLPSLVSVPLLALVHHDGGPAGPVDPRDKGRITGRVSSPGGPVTFANVVVVGTRRGTMTDSSGRFILVAVPTGIQAVRFQAVAHERFDTVLHVRPNEVESLDVRMQRARVLTEDGDVLLVDDTKPCARPDPADTNCIMRDPEERARVGSRCSVHRRTRLLLDLVPIIYGLATIGSDHRDHHPNARMWRGGGCVVRPPRWAEAAYCEKCRAAFHRAHPAFKPIEVRRR